MNGPSDSQRPARAAWLLRSEPHPLSRATLPGGAGLRGRARPTLDRRSYLASPLRCSRQLFAPVATGGRPRGRNGAGSAATGRGYLGVSACPRGRGATVWGMRKCRDRLGTWGDGWNASNSCGCAASRDSIPRGGATEYQKSLRIGANDLLPDLGLPSAPEEIGGSSPRASPTALE